MVRDESAAADPRRSMVEQMSGRTVEMLKLVRDGFARLDRAALASARQIGTDLQHTEQRAIASMVAGAPSGAGVAEAVFLPMHLGLIARNVDALAEASDQVASGATLFTERASGELASLFGLAIDLLESVRDALKTGNRALIAHVLDEARRIETASNEYALSHQRRLIEGVCVPRASSTFLAMLDDLKGIEWHAREVGAKLAVLRRPAELEERRRPPGGVTP